MRGNKRNFPLTRFRYRNICRNINGMPERLRHADGDNSSCIENNFEMFVARTTGQLRVCKAMLLRSLEGRQEQEQQASTIESVA